MSAPDAQVLIAGAGPTGLTLAIDLARRGIAVRVLEKADRPFPGSRGKAISPRTLEVLDDLGVVDEVLAEGTTHLRVRAYDGVRLIAEADTQADDVPDSPAIPYREVVWLPQFRTEAILRARLAELGVHVELNRELVSAEQDGDRVTATIAHHDDGTVEHARAAFLVGCDGGHSTVRHIIGTPFEGVTHEEEQWVLVGDVTLTGLSPDFSHLWNDHSHGMLLLTPFHGTDRWQFQVLPARGGATPPEPSLRSFREILASRVGRPDVRILDATWLSKFRTNERIATDYRDGRLLLAGDAAHVYSPAGGQGMTTGIQDAYNLGWKLAAVLGGGAGGALLDTYQAERQPVARRALTGSGKRWNRVNEEVSGTDNPQFWAAVINYETSQLLIGYAGGPLAAEGATATLRTGDRAPDAPVTHPVTGAAARVFDLLRGPQATRLVFGGPDLADPGLGPSLTDQPRTLYGVDVHTVPVIDGTGTAREIYGLPAGGPTTTVTVRPDGYIAAIASA